MASGIFDAALQIGPLAISPHFFLESLAYIVGFALYGDSGSIGVVQAAWIVPLWSHFNRAGETETAKGLLIAAGIVFLLNAGCWGLVATPR